jgi:hypothetical protein
MLPKATGGDATKVAWGIQNPEQKPSLTSQGIDKNLANCANDFEESWNADWGWDMPEVGLFLVGVGTTITLVALIWLILVPRWTWLD